MLQDLPPEGVERYFLTAEGQDKPGMVRQISARLAQEGIDITDVFARRADEGLTFVMVMELAVLPASTPWRCSGSWNNSAVPSASPPRCSTRTSSPRPTIPARCAWHSDSGGPRPPRNRRSPPAAAARCLFLETEKSTSMPQTDDILSTLRMVKQENLDVRTVTMGINLAGCVDRDVGRTCDLIARTIRTAANKLKETCATVSSRYGIPIVNRRLSVTPIVRIADGFDPDAMVRIAKVLDESAEAVQVDLIGGYSALVHGGLTAAAKNYLESLPAALASTQRVCASVNAATTKAGINMTAVALLGQKIRDIAEATADRHGFGCAKLCVFANAPEDNPFMAGGFHGEGSPDTVIHIGVSGPGVVKRALERLHQTLPGSALNDIAEEIKSTAFRVTPWAN